MKIRQFILHKIIGHIPYLVRQDQDDKYYRCTICKKTLHLGAYNQLYEETLVKL